MSPGNVDLLIVGSGPIGATYARLVAEGAPDARILMVESGPQLTERPGMHVRNIADPDARATAQRLSEGVTRDERARAEKAAAEAAVAAIDRVLVRPGIFYAEPRNAASLAPSTLALSAMASNVGGMGAHWAFACPYPGGSERIPWIGDADWEAMLDVARRLLKVSPHVFPQTRQSCAILTGLAEEFKELPAGRQVQPMPLACQVLADERRYWTGPDVVLGDLVHSPRFDLQASTLCRQLVHDGRSVTGAVIEDRTSGEYRHIVAKAVVVAGDSLRTPQLLWASGIRPPALGRYLNDHAELLMAVQLDTQLIDRVAQQRPDLPDARREGDDALIGVFWVPYSGEHPFHGQVMHLDLAPIEIAPGTPHTNQIVGLGWFVPKDVQADDRVCFSDVATDGYGMPQISTVYRFTERDLERIEAARADMKRAAGALGPALPDSAEPKLLPPGSSLHYQGTVRMGQVDDSASVCDDHLRVWGFTNLFVGGNGTIPTATACNPTLTSVALAVRGSAALAQLLS